MSKRNRRNQTERKKRWSRGSIVDPDQVKGLISYHNWFDKPDPTPAQADRIDIFELSVLTTE